MQAVVDLTRDVDKIDVRKIGTNREKKIEMRRSKMQRSKKGEARN